jgi:hypothetical protein
MRKIKSIRDHDIDTYGAVEQPDGSYLHYDGEIHWYNKQGSRHCDYGPAILHSSGRVFWILHGISYEFDDWLKLTPITDEQKLLLRLQYD